MTATPLIDTRHGDALELLRRMPDESVDCAVTSPPYFGLRDYHIDGQLGLEKTPEEYIAKLVEVFRECWRVIHRDGVLWVNIGDSYAGSWGNCGGKNRAAGKQRQITSGSRVPNHAWDDRTTHIPSGARGFPGIKPKDLIGIPYMLAFALRADGWYWRSVVIWAKPNGMPGSQDDRPTCSFEPVLLFSKSRRYWSDFDAIKTPPRESSLIRAAQDTQMQAGSHRGHAGMNSNGPMKAVGVYSSAITGSKRGRHTLGDNMPEDERRELKSLPEGQSNIRKARDKQRGRSRRHAGFNDRWDSMSKQQQQQQPAMIRDVWFIPPEPSTEAHFAMMPTELARRCILSGCPEGGTVLDPFSGAATTGVACLRLNRNYIGLELNAEYIAMSERRIAKERWRLAHPGHVRKPQVTGQPTLF